MKFKSDVDITNKAFLSNGIIVKQGCVQVCGHFFMLCTHARKHAEFEKILLIIEMFRSKQSQLPNSVYIILYLITLSLFYTLIAYINVIHE